MCAYIPVPETCDKCRVASIFLVPEIDKYLKGEEVFGTCIVCKAKKLIKKKEERRKKGEERIEELKRKHTELQAVLTKSPTTIVAMELTEVSIELSDLLYARNSQEGQNAG